jgi:hypothetical protein
MRAVPTHKCCKTGGSDACDFNVVAWSRLNGFDGVKIKPALALGGWVAFKPMGAEVMVMGDLVLRESEINPVMTKIIENGVQITAVHNHLLRALRLALDAMANVKNSL